MLVKWMNQHIDRCCYCVCIPWRGCHVWKDNYGKSYIMS